MERRKFLIGAGSLAAGSAAAVGTGAFNSADVRRNVSVNVADDTAAYVAFDPNSGQHSNFASLDGGGELKIQLDGDGVSGQGINEDSNYSILEICEVTNQGNEPAFFYVPPSSVTINGNSVADGTTDDYIDPQATSLPGGNGEGGGSLTGVYIPDLQNNWDAETMANEFDTIFGTIASNNNYNSGSGMFTVGPGNSFYLGLSLDESGDGQFGAVSMSLHADTNIV